VDNEVLLLTAEKLYEKEPVTIFHPSEFIDFFQKAPIALHWLSGI
jgi:hypothetical protein